MAKQPKSGHVAALAEPVRELRRRWLTASSKFPL